jgi:hypothetical protein
VAKTLTVGTALHILSARNPRILTESFGARFADEVQAFMWYRHPWRESLADLPPFSLVPDEPRYGPPTLAVPPDFYGLHDAWLRNMSGGQQVLLVQKDLRPSGESGVPTSICYDGASGSFILHPRPALSAPDWWVEGRYKKTPTKITNETVMSHVLPWDDIYFAVFRAGLNWKLAQEIERSRDWPNEFAAFLRAVDDMARTEGIISGVEVISPDVSLEYGD